MNPPNTNPAQAFPANKALKNPHFRRRHGNADEGEDGVPMDAEGMQEQVMPPSVDHANSLMAQQQQQPELPVSLQQQAHLAPSIPTYQTNLTMVPQHLMPPVVEAPKLPNPASGQQQPQQQPPPQQNMAGMLDPVTATAAAAQASMKPRPKTQKQVSKSVARKHKMGLDAPLPFNVQEVRGDEANPVKYHFLKTKNGEDWRELELDQEGSAISTNVYRDSRPQAGLFATGEAAMKRDKCSIRKLALQTVTFFMRKMHFLLEWDDPRADRPVEEPSPEVLDSYLTQLRAHGVQMSSDLYTTKVFKRFVFHETAFTPSLRQWYHTELVSRKREVRQLLQLLRMSELSTLGPASGWSKLSPEATTEVRAIANAVARLINDSRTAGNNESAASNVNLNDHDFATLHNFLQSPRCSKWMVGGGSKRRQVSVKDMDSFHMVAKLAARVMSAHSLHLNEDTVSSSNPTTIATTATPHINAMASFALPPQFNQILTPGIMQNARKVLDSCPSQLARDLLAHALTVNKTTDQSVDQMDDKAVRSHLRVCLLGDFFGGDEAPKLHTNPAVTLPIAPAAPPSLTEPPKDTAPPSHMQQQQQATHHMNPAPQAMEVVPQQQQQAPDSSTGEKRKAPEMEGSEPAMKQARPAVQL